MITCGDEPLQHTLTSSITSQTCGCQHSETSQRVSQCVCVCTHTRVFYFSFFFCHGVKEETGILSGSGNCLRFKRHPVQYKCDAFRCRLRHVTTPSHSSVSSSEGDCEAGTIRVPPPPSLSSLCLWLHRREWERFLGRRGKRGKTRLEECDS